jgi:hypothetical protein
MKTHRSLLALFLAPLLLFSLSPPGKAAVTGRSEDSSIAGTEKLLSDSSGADTFIAVSTLLANQVLTPTSVNGLTITTTTGTLTIPNGVTLTGPSASGTAATLAGTQTLTNKTINLGSNTLVATSAQLLAALTNETGTGAAVFATSPTIAAPVFSGSITGTYTLAGTPTITSPTISGPTLSGSVLGTYTLAGTPTITSPTISGPTITGTTATSGAITQTSASATAFQTGPNGGTNPVFRTVNNVSSAATGISITGRAATAGADITVLSSGTNENLVINAKGSGTITLNPTATGNIVLGQAATTAFPITQTSASATAFESGPNGATNPVFRLVNNVSSAATGISITGRAAAGGVDITALSSGTNESLVINAKGSGALVLNPTATGAINMGDATNPALSVVHTTGGTGVSFTSAAAGSGSAIAAISSGTNENLSLDAKGSGTITLNATGTGAVRSARGFLSLDFTESVTATNVITAAESGSVFFLNSATEFASTLPAPAAGLHYTFIVVAAPSGASYTVTTNSSANIIKGMQLTSADSAGDTGTSDDTVTFVDSQAVAGDMIEVWSDGTSWFVVAKSRVAAAITFTTAS